MSQIFDPNDWKLTLPVDKSGGIGGTAVEVLDLTRFEDPRYFHTEGDALVFSAPVDGATTSGSHYARSELREMNGAARAAWTLEEGGEMVATLKVDQVPTKTDGTPGRIVIGQIHGQDDELVRLYWADNSVYFVNDKAGPRDAETTYQLLNAQGQKANISLDEVFSYDIDTHDGVLSVSVHADGQEYSSTTQVSDTWNSDHFYFKAGVYLGVAEPGSGAGSVGSGSGEASFYNIQVSHDGTPLSPVPVEPVTTTPTPTTPTVPTTPMVPTTPVVPEPYPGRGPEISGTSRADTLTGTARSEKISGGKGNDVLSGGAGDDEIWGNSGSDTLVGGSGDDWLKGGDGSDTYVFAAGHGHDVVHEFRGSDDLVFKGGLFPSVKAAQAALVETDHGIVLTTGSGSNITFTDTTLKQLLSADWFVS